VDALGNIWVVELGGRVIAAFTSKRTLKQHIRAYWPKCPSALRIFKLRDGGEHHVADVTAKIYGVTVE
jgi:hypothetical protein